MMRSRSVAWIATIAVGVLAAACAQVPKPAISLAELQTYYVESVDISVASDAQVSWSEVEDEYARTAGITMPPPAAGQDSRIEQQKAGAAYQAAMAAPESRAFIGDRIAAPFRAALTAKMTGAIQGQMPARINVVIRQLVIPSPAQRVLLGGNHLVVADVALLDASGRELAAQKPMTVQVAAGQGLLGVAVDQAFEAPIDQLSQSTATRFRRWLLQET